MDLFAFNANILLKNYNVFFIDRLVVGMNDHVIISWLIVAIVLEIFNVQFLSDV